MPTHTRNTWPPTSWQQELRSALRTAAELLQVLDLTPDQFTDHPSGSVEFSPEFPVLVPSSFANRMMPGDPRDPLLRQVLSGSEESTSHPGFHPDPLAETDPGLGLRRSPGLIQKYRGRALIIAAQGGAVHCRYCFRRHFPYSDNRSGPNLEVLDGIRQDLSIGEIILSGGDPLLLNDKALEELLHELDEIAHVHTVRIHSRIPTFPRRSSRPRGTCQRNRPRSRSIALRTPHGGAVQGRPDGDEGVLKGVPA